MMQMHFHVITNVEAEYNLRCCISGAVNQDLLRQALWPELTTQINVVK